MKCPKCDGKGTVLKIIYEDWQKDEIVRSAVKCPRCNGSGEVPTNEEWFVSLPTEEKAKWLTNHSKFIYECGQKQVAPKTMYEEDWEWWLKQPHTAK